MFLIKVACSDRHVVVATSENEVFSWGRNEDGCLGLDGLGEAKNQEQSTQPLVISSPQKVAQLARNRDKDKAKGSKKKTDNSIVIKVRKPFENGEKRTLFYNF